ncbi:SURF1 family protein [Brevibacterium sp. UMB10442]|nr:SURF1 family protein [Brevibacterium sp. UMB10442]
MLRLALTPKWIGGFVLVLALATAFVFLSMWQVDRAQHKNDVQTSAYANDKTPLNEVVSAQVPMPSRDTDRLVEVSGSYVPDATVLVDGRHQNGQRGFWVVTMFTVDNAQLGGGLSGDKPVAIPVIRGFTADEATARNSQAPSGTHTLVARIGPTEAPEPSVGDKVVTTVSTAQLVNYFDVYSYGAMLFPEPDQRAQASGPELEHVTFHAQESGGLDVQSAFYAVEWLVFAGFAFYIWWRLLRDEYRKQTKDEHQHFVVVKKPGQKNLDN